MYKIKLIKINNIEVINEIEPINLLPQYLDLFKNKITIETEENLEELKGLIIYPEINDSAFEDFVTLNYKKNKLKFELIPKQKKLFIKNN